VPQPWFFDAVFHDSEQAMAAQAGLANAAGSLSEALALIETDLPVVVEDWTGSARWAFDVEMRSVLEAGHLLLASLVAGVSAIAFHDELARNEVTRRDALRESWRADQAALAAAAAEATAAAEPAGGD
jgi:hypothetical protein